MNRDETRNDGTASNGAPHLGQQNCELIPDVDLPLPVDPEPSDNSRFFIEAHNTKVPDVSPENTSNGRLTVGQQEKSNSVSNFYG
jgi:hypothetical protein